MSLFSRSPKKDSSTEPDDEMTRARIQAAIERALQVPEPEVPPFYKAKQFSGRDKASENAA